MIGNRAKSGQSPAAGHSASTGKSETADGWAAAAPELVIAVLLVAAVAAAAWAWAGPGLAGVVVAAATLGFLGLLRYLPATEDPPALTGSPGESSATVYTSIAGMWRIRSLVKNATENKDSYDRELRITLQQLLAARLAERHGISLHDEPAAARRLLTGKQGSITWEWLDPGRSTGPAGSAGIPPRTLGAILTQLEQL
jgi:hypothetical protein